MAFTRGTKLGPYEIDGPLGVGGMGEVYRGRDTRLDRPVAIKFLQAHLAADAEQRERFDREARAISNLVHPNVCTLFDVGEYEGRRFLVMELLEGETLAERIARGPLASADALRAARELAAALAAAHRRGLIHRDVKPANVMLTEHGAKLLDFGLTKADATATHDVTVAHTQPGMVVGTLAYMSPEQLTGGHVDQRADVYAFGVTLFEMCTGRRPFVGSTEAGLMAAVLRDTPPSASATPGIPPGMGAIIDRCLEREPSRRFASAEGLVVELARDDLASTTAPARQVATQVVKAAPRLPAAGVVDFRNITGDPSFDWLSTGIAETVTVDLKKLATLTLVSRDKMAAAFGTLGDAADRQTEFAGIARSLGLDLLVTGGYQTMGRAVRLTATLVDVQRGEITESVKVDGQLDDIFSLQDRLIAGLIEAARVDLSASARDRLARVRDPKVEAYELFARGRQLVQQMGPAGLSEARSLLEKAVEIDPQYAVAYGALGSAWAMRFIGTSNRSDLDVAVSYLTHAIELDPHLGEPYAWLSYCRGRQQRFDDARAAGRRSVELDPGSFYSPYFLGAALWMEGNEAFRPGVWAEALEALGLARSNAPRIVTTSILLSDVWLRCGRYNQALESARHAVDLEESGRAEGHRMVGAHAVLGSVLVRLGALDDAERVLVASADRLAVQDHVYTPAYTAITALGLAEIAMRRQRTADARSHCRDVIETCHRHARAIGLGWLAVRGRIGMAAADHELGKPDDRDASLRDGLELLRSQGSHDYSTVFQGGLAQSWMDAAALYGRMGHEADGFDALVNAVEAGWSDPTRFETDPHLAPFRARPEYARLQQVVTERAQLPPTEAQG